MATNKKNEILKFYKLHPNAKDPIYATEGSACFDLHACFDGLEKYQLRQDTLNRLIEKPFKNGVLQVNNMERVMIPTGLIFDIPEGYSVRLHSRSGLAWNEGLYLTNCEGIIDSDYYHQTYVMLYNASADEVRIYHGDKIAQGEMVKTHDYQLEQTEVVPEKTTNRVGGFGSTGV